MVTPSPTVRVAQPGTLVDRAAGADGVSPSRETSGVDHRVRADRDPRLDDGAGRLQDGHARVHQGLQVAVDEQPVDAAPARRGR